MMVSDDGILLWGVIVGSMRFVRIQCSLTLESVTMS